jgi:uncharacterized protein (TIGR02596 family)
MKYCVPGRQRGFSLVELIVVISVIVIVMTLLVPAFGTLGRASRLNTGIASVVDELNLARQTALSKNRAVEVRFYHLPGPVDPVLAYRSIRTLISDESGATYLPLSPLKALPTGIVVLEDKTFSTLLSDETRPPVTTDVEDLPDAKTTHYKSIRFRPTGGVELATYAGNDTWFLSIKNERDPTFTDRPADNYTTIQLDPITGRVRQFRP